MSAFENGYLKTKRHGFIFTQNFGQKNNRPERERMGGVKKVQRTKGGVRGNVLSEEAEGRKCIGAEGCD